MCLHTPIPSDVEWLAKIVCEKPKILILPVMGLLQDQKKVKLIGEKVCFPTAMNVFVTIVGQRCEWAVAPWQHIHMSCERSKIKIHLKSSWNPFEMLLKSMSHGNTLIWVVKDKELHNVIYWEQTDHLRVEIELILQQTACFMTAHNRKHPVLGTLTFAASLTLRSSLPVWSLVTSGKAFWFSALSEV